MSRNLCKDKCCGIRIKLADLVGQPLEFRKYADYHPVPGVKWICPKCKRAYFVHIRTHYRYWGEDNLQNFDQEMLHYPGQNAMMNQDKGKFAKRVKDLDGRERVEELGYYEFDMSFYESYNDEGEGKDVKRPAYWCGKDDERTRRYL
jgi:hypothetical protein